MLKKTLLGLAVVLVALSGLIATRPSTYAVQRQATIKAPPDIIFALVNDFHRWSDWSPWEKLDPNMKRTFDGAASGTGALYGWSGNDKVGEGRMTIEESKANELVRIKLEFIKPWEAASTTVFVLKPTAEGVSVTWSMAGNNDFIGKAFSLFMDMDAMIGKDFDEGLATMRKVAEADAQKRAETEGQPPPEGTAAAPTP